MDREFFTDLLKRYANGEATAEEIRFLEAYYKSFELKPDATDGLTKRELEELALKIRKGISPAKEIPSGLNRRHLWRNWPRFVAAAVVVLVCGMLIFHYQANDRDRSAVTEAVDRKLPAKTNNLIQLPDGSMAILAPGSTLEYPDSFEGAARREVVLKGEAYFDVEHMPHQPFVVLSGALKTTVLGTTFNVKAFPGSESITVTVISGKVQVGDEKETFAVLLPDEEMVYHIPEAKKAVRTVESGGVAGWLQEDLYCDDITVEQAAVLIEQRYGVVVEVPDPALRSRRFTTTFTRNETLESVLNSLAMFNGAVYSIDTAKEKVTLSLKPL